ncbi:MAG TPA: hypothetical protein VGI45_09095 [Terracidiphilus sp.]|jgi:hypothetical protein
MSDGFKLDIDMRDIVKAFDSLAPNIQRKVAKEALNKAGEIFTVALETAIDATDKGTGDDNPQGDSLPKGFMRNDVVFNVKGGTLEVGFSPLTAHVARWQDKGWTLTHGDNKIKDIPPRDFSGKAFDAAAELALEAVVESLRSNYLLDINGSVGSGTGNE